MRRLAASLFVVALAGCTTVQSQRETAPDFEASTVRSLDELQGCIAERTAKQHVQYLPRLNGGTFTASAGPQNYVMWVADIDDLGESRRIRIHSPGPAGKLVEQIRPCL